MPIKDRKIKMINVSMVFFYTCLIFICHYLTFNDPFHINVGSTDTIVESNDTCATTIQTITSLRQQHKQARFCPQ